MPAINKFSEEIINVYHASKTVVEFPQWDYVDSDKKDEEVRKDFGQGFYTSRDTAYPIYRYSADNDVVILNKYELNISGLRKLELEDDLKWLLVTAAHRRNFSKHKKWHGIRDSIREQLAAYELVIGSISNDNFYSAFEAFLASADTDVFTLKLAQLLNYPAQYVLKSDKACQQIRYIGHEQIALATVEKFRAKNMEDRENMDDRVFKMREAALADGTLYSGKLFRTIMEEVVARGSFAV